MEVQRTAPERHSSMFLAIVSLRSWLPATCTLSSSTPTNQVALIAGATVERFRYHTNGSATDKSQTRFGTRRGAAQAGNRMIRMSVENPRYDDGRWPPRLRETHAATTVRPLDADGK